MADGEHKSMPDSLLDAVERTFQNTLGSAGLNRDSAKDLVDEVVRRSGEGAAAATEFGSRIRDSIKDLRLATGDDIKRIQAELEEMKKRLTALEEAIVFRASTPKDH